MFKKETKSSRMNNNCYKYKYVIWQVVDAISKRIIKSQIGLNRTYFADFSRLNWP